VLRVLEELLPRDLPKVALLARLRLLSIVGCLSFSLLNALLTSILHIIALVLLLELVWVCEHRLGELQSLPVVLGLEFLVVSVAFPDKCC